MGTTVRNGNLNLRDIRWFSMDWIIVAQDRNKWRAPVNTLLNLEVAQNSWDFLSTSTSGRLSRIDYLHGVTHRYLVRSIKTVLKIEVRKWKMKFPSVYECSLWRK
jgi:hypothetical protein